MNRLLLLGAVGGSFLIGFGLGSYFAKPAPVMNYHTPVTPAKEENDMPDEKPEITEKDEVEVVLDRTNPMMDRDEEDVRRTPYHSPEDLEVEDDLLPLDPNDPYNPDNNFDPLMSDIEVVTDRDEWLSNYQQYKTLHMRSFLGQGIVIDESHMILPRERVKDLVGDWDDWIETGDTATEVYLYNHRFNYRVFLEGVSEITYTDFREEVHNGRGGE
jgi:hypothetical protein